MTRHIAAFFCAVLCLAGHAVAAPAATTMAPDTTQCLKRLFARNMNEPQAQWFFDMMRHPTSHSLVRLAEENRGPKFPAFNARPSAKEQKVVFEVNAGAACATNPSVASQGSFDVARALFIREAQFAMTLEKDNRVADYLDCASAKSVASTRCWHLLFLPHFAAVDAQWQFAKRNGLTRLFPDGLANTPKSASPKAESNALLQYLLQGQLPYLPWLQKYAARTDIDGQ